MWKNLVNIIHFDYWKFIFSNYLLKYILFEECDLALEDSLEIVQYQSKIKAKHQDLYLTSDFTCCNIIFMAKGGVWNYISLSFCFFLNQVCEYIKFLIWAISNGVL